MPVFVQVFNMAVLQRSIAILIILKFSSGRSVSNNGCSIQFTTDMEKKSPLFLTNTMEKLNFILPQKGYINLKQNQKLLLVCSGPNNTLEIGNTNQTFIKCNGDDSFEIDNEETISLDDLLCTKTSKADVLNSNQVCGDGGVIKYIGYKITEGKWLNLINICYNEDNGQTIFAQHDIIGNEIKHASKTNYRLPFSVQGLGSDTPADVVFKQVFQKSKFNKLIGSAHKSAKYLNKKHYLERGHLAADADFLLSTWQYATYFYINTCPQWNTINNGNWKVLELMVRKTAEHYNTTLKVTTGTHEVLRLPNANGDMVEIYLANDKLPVPKFVYKIVCTESDNQCIVLVSVNNPFLSKIEKEEMLCKNVCDKYGWEHDRWNEIKRGFIYCCELPDFRRSVNNLPNIVAKGVLVGISY